MLEMVDPTWRTTRWLQLVVQGISDNELPWYELIIPLMVGTESAALSLAKHLLTIWRWSIKVQGWDICPPTLTALNTGQFMTREEVLENVDDSLWFVAYSHALQRVCGSCVWLMVAMAKGEGARGRSLPTGQGILGRNRHRAHHLLHETLLGTFSEGCIQKEGKGHNIPCNHLSG